MSLDPSQGDLVDGRYELEVELGRGGFGVVWRAIDRSSGQVVAIKFLRSADVDNVARFRREAESLMRVQSPFCLRPIAYGLLDSVAPYLVTEFVAGETLPQWLDRNPPMEQMLSVAAGIATGLDAAHREGIIHRDLKPENVLIRDPAGDPTPAVIDFGLAKLTARPDRDVTKTGEILGTVGFMSPEQLRGVRHIGPATDMYAFGALLFEMFSGRPPFVGATALEVAMMHLRENPADLDGPPTLAALVRRLLSKEPGDRVSAQACIHVLRGRGNPDSDPQQPKRTWSPIALAGGVVLILALAALVATILWPRPMELRRETPRPGRLAALNRPSNPPTSAKGHAVPAPEPVEIVDVGLPVDVDGTPPAACADMPAFSPGLTTIPGAEGLWARLPDGYTPNRRYKLLVVFHDGWQEPERVLKSLRLVENEISDEFVAIAPLGNPHAEKWHWQEPHVQRMAFAQIDNASKTLCVDAEHPYVLGFGAGGHVATQMACEYPQLSALATFGYRPDAPREGVAICRPQTPTIHIAPTLDPIRPVDGSLGCTSGSGKFLSLPEFEESSAAALKCTSPPTSFPGTGGVCRVYDCPNDKLKFCEVAGGRFWPGAQFNAMTQLAFSARCTASPSPTFDVMGEIWRFFDEQPTKSSD